MPEVNVEINGRKYRMACAPGEEQHLADLAAQFDQRVQELKGAVGEIGDSRLTVMAGIAVLDDLNVAEQTIAALRDDIAQLKEAGEALSRESEELEGKLARRLADAARKLEAIAASVEDSAAATSPVSPGGGGAPTQSSNPPPATQSGGAG